jgi:hypothetical protein
MTETTRALAHLPAMDIELVHDRSDDGTAERLAIRLTGRPDLGTAAKAFEPHLWTAVLAANPWLKLQADLVQKVWGPLLAMNPMLRPLLPPPDRRD